MDSRITDILRYSLLLTVLLVGSLFAHKHYKRYVTKKEIVAELLEVHRRVKDTQPEDSWDRCLAEQFRVVLARGDKHPLQGVLKKGSVIPF